MNSIMKAIDYESLLILKEQRELLKNKFQVLKAMLGIKKKNVMKEEQPGYDF